jgi:hypothetical protein
MQQRQGMANNGKIRNPWLEISNDESNAKLDTFMVYSNDTKGRLDIQRIQMTPETKLYPEILNSLNV